ncbi:MAG: sulfatase-like hydrolase/transferase [Planctomycetota bacterium]|jgi:arylsulfatase
MNTRRDFLKAMGFGAASLALPGCASILQRTGDEAAKDRPNIILIMADDMGFSDLGCYGSEIHTPNLDRLAAGGLRFTQFYNGARCCPTRASLLTGLYAHQAGVGGMTSAKDDNPPGPYQGYLNDKCVTIAEVLKKAGYTTLMSGKWHVGETQPHWPVNRGFDRYYGLISGGANYFDITKGKRKNTRRRFAVDDKPHIPPKENFYITDAFTDNAVEFVEQYGRADRPFFLYVAYTAPHWPLHALPEDIAKYKGKYLSGWDALRKQRYKRMIEMGIIDKKWPLTPRDEGAVPWDGVEDKELMDLKMAVYAAQIDRMDQGIGKIMAKLEQVGKDENTLILFLSDNGGCHETGPLGFDSRKNGLPPGGVDSYMSYGQSWANASNTPFRLFKKFTHEGGIATPLIAHWPAVIKDKGKLTQQVGHIIDIMATCADVAGAQYPKTFNDKKIIPLQGESLLPIFQGKKRRPHEYLFWEHRKHEAVRHGKWKLVARKRTRWELYDLEQDRSEMNNLADKYPQIVQHLKSKYEQWAERVGVRR